MKDTGGLSRRHAIGAAIGGAVAAVGAAFRRPADAGTGFTLRPPGALPEKEFLGACARCFKCVNACPNGCLKVHGFRAGLDVAFTPYINARERGCTLCGDCAQVCPTGALRPFEANREGWKAGVDMGTARVNQEMCYSFHGRTCGACYRACPLAGEAIKIGVFETPHVQADVCVGCGLCEQACLHLPQAIRVVPARVMEGFG